MNDEPIYCIGCGAEIQSEDKNARGYTPKSVVKKGLENNALYCQRCFKLRHYNQLESIETTEEEFTAILNGISDTQALVVNVIDIFDIAGSIIPGIQRIIGNNELIIVANKVDLLPKEINRNRLKHRIQKILSDQGVHVRDVLFTGAAKNLGVDELYQAIDKARHGRDVYVVGVANVGKSTLINALIKSRGIQGEVITTSQYPGTTLDIIEIPFDDESALIDTPGIIHKGQMTVGMSHKTLKQILPTSEVRPRIYQLNPEQTLFIGGLAQLDYVSGERQSLTVYASNALNIHRRKLEGADDFYAKHVGELLSPPTKAELTDEIKRNTKHYTIDEPCDIAISGLGWIKVSQPGQLQVRVPKGVDVFKRAPLI